MAKVTAGLLVFYGVSGRALTLQAKDLVATLQLGDTGSFPIPSGPFQPGSIINISGNLVGDQTLKNGPAYYKGTSYPRLWYEGSLAFTAKPVPAPANSAIPVSVHTSFTFKATLKAYQSNNINGGGGPAVINLALTGKGHATAILGASFNVGGGTLARDVRVWVYDFDN